MSKVSLARALKSIKKLVDYLEQDEAKHFEEWRIENPEGSLEGHVYTHVKRVKRWLRELQNGSL